jgi:tetratricopeptide (TPR) repeat protein
VEPRILRTLAIGFFFLGFSACASVRYSPQNAKIKNELTQAECLSARGNYGQAISRYEQTLAKSPKNPWRDRVLFNLACLYALTENPDKDLARSRFYLQKLKEEFPISRFRAGIEMWGALLEKLVSLETEMEARKVEFAEKQSALEQELAGLKAERRELESSWSSELNLKARKLRDLETMIQTQKSVIEALQGQLNKMKEIDIQSEKKAKGIK